MQPEIYQGQIRLRKCHGRVDENLYLFWIQFIPSLPEINSIVIQDELYENKRILAALENVIVQDFFHLEKVVFWFRVFSDNRDDLEKRLDVKIEAVRERLQSFRQSLARRLEVHPLLFDVFQGAGFIAGAGGVTCISKDFTLQLKVLSDVESFYIHCMTGNAKLLKQELKKNQKWWASSCSEKTQNTNFKHKITRGDRGRLREDISSVAHDGFGFGLIHMASLYGRSSAVQVLLDFGADPNSKDQKGSTPLHYACCYGHLEVAKVLVQQRGANVNATDSQGRSPLHVAGRSQTFYRGDKGTTSVILPRIEKLIRRGTVPPNVLELPNQPFCPRRDLKVVNYLIAQGADLNLKDLQGKTALQEAFVQRNWPLVDFLIKHGALSKGSLKPEEILWKRECRRGTMPKSLHGTRIMASGTKKAYAGQTSHALEGSENSTAKESSPTNLIRQDYTSVELPYHFYPETLLTAAMICLYVSATCTGLAIVFRNGLGSTEYRYTVAATVVVVTLFLVIVWKWHSKRLPCDPAIQ